MYKDAMASIEEGPHRKPAERVDFLHPEFPQQEMEDKRLDYSAQVEQYKSGMESISDPDLKEMFEGLLFLVENLNERLKGPEEDRVEKQTKDRRWNASFPSAGIKPSIPRNDKPLH